MLGAYDKMLAAAGLSEGITFMQYVAYSLPISIGLTVLYILICRFGNLFLMVSPMCLRILTVPASTVFIFMVRTIISSGCIADVTRWCGRHP
jgi:hypothetical protein